MPRVKTTVAAIGLNQFYSDNLWRNTDPLYDEAYSSLKGSSSYGDSPDREHKFRGL